MGICISKCTHPKSVEAKEECDSVQDKMVISQIHVSSSTTTTTACTTFSSSPSTTTRFSSSFSIPQNKVFSHDLICDPHKYNSNITPVHHLKLLSPVNASLKSPSPVRPVIYSHQPKPLNPSGTIRSGGLKRTHTISSPLSQLKSRRRVFEQEPIALTVRNLSSPSANRSFDTNVKQKVCSKNPSNLISKKTRQIDGRVENLLFVDSEKENLQHIKNEGWVRQNPYPKRRETLVHQIHANKDDDDDEIAGSKSTPHNSSCSLHEDIDNPLISLDCFIFL